jgi:hypothetical protein
MHRRACVPCVLVAFLTLLDVRGHGNALRAGQIPDSPVPHAFTKFPRTKYKFDADKAKQLLDQAGWTVGADGIRKKGGERLAWRVPPDAADANVAKVNSASGSDRNQDVGGTVLQYITHAVVMAEGRSTPRLPWSTGETRVPSIRASLARAPSRGMTFGPRMRTSGGLQTINSEPSALQAIFVATGRSSGAAFQMTVAYDGSQPLELVDPGFVLEPVQGVSAAESERELRRVKGRRKTVTIDGYCLQMRKPPPAAGMVYRLAKNPIQERNAHLAPIMFATKALKETGELHADTDPVQYFHTIRQWALWAHEQRWKTEAEFADAFVEHSKKNVSAAGRQWTPELEQNLRRLMPNRWRDISAALKLAGIFTGEGQ